MNQNDKKTPRTWVTFLDNPTSSYYPATKKKMKTYDNSDWKAVANGGTVKIATQKTFRVYDAIPRGASEQISKACDASLKEKALLMEKLGSIKGKKKAEEYKQKNK